MSEKHERIDESEEEDFENIKGEKFNSTCYESLLECCGNMTGCLRIWCPCICCCCTSPIYQIETAKVGVHQSFGRYLQMLRPGIHLINPVSESVIEVDMKTSVFGMAPQQVITKDNVSMQIETVVYYRAINPHKLVYKLRNNTSQIREFIKEISYSALRSVIGENIFQELLEHRAKLAHQLEDYVKEKVYPWGLYIENIFIKGTSSHTQMLSFPPKCSATSSPQPSRNVSPKPPSSPPRPTSSPPRCSRKPPKFSTPARPCRSATSKQSRISSTAAAIRPCSSISGAKSDSIF